MDRKYKFTRGGCFFPFGTCSSRIPKVKTDVPVYFVSAYFVAALTIAPRRDGPWTQSSRNWVRTLHATAAHVHEHARW